MDVLKIKNCALKQAIVVRTDLKMNKGKIAAQVAHASLSAYLKTVEHDIHKANAKKWIKEGMKKIVLKVADEKQLFYYFEQIKDNRLPAVLISDAGLTQIKSGTPTCFGVGPADAREIDIILGKLKLL